MKRGQYLFTDVVAHEGVYEYVDCYNQRWMANYFRWGFRVKINSPGIG